MEVKINNNGEMLDATIEMVDGVMVVSPKEVKIDIAQFKDGDIITCGHDDPSFNWTCILRGRIEFICDNMFIADYCFYRNDSDYSCKQGDSDSATFVRFATEEEKKKLFDKLAEEGYEWKAETKELVKLKWMPKEGEEFYLPLYYTYPSEFKPITSLLNKGRDKVILDKGWVFRTKEECQEFCNRLNDAINSVKP